MGNMNGVTAIDTEGQPSVYFATGKSLGQMTAEVDENNHVKGWYDTGRSFAEGIALLHSELSEALDAYREIGLTERTRTVRYGDPLGKPDDVGSELADVFIRLLDEASRQGIDLEREYERKMAYNRTRPHRHGGKSL